MGSRVVCVPVLPRCGNLPGSIEMNTQTLTRWPTICHGKTAAPLMPTRSSHPRPMMGAPRTRKSAASAVALAGFASATSTPGWKRATPARARASSSARHHPRPGQRRKPRQLPARSRRRSTTSKASRPSTRRYSRGSRNPRQPSSLPPACSRACGSSAA